MNETAESHGAEAVHAAVEKGATVDKVKEFLLRGAHSWLYGSNSTRSAGGEELWR